MMKKITLLLMLLTASFGFSQALPFDFQGTTHGFTPDGGSAISNGTGSDVLQIVGATADWDNAQVTFAMPIDLSDDANNTLKFTIQSTTANAGEVHQHGVSFQGGGGAIEMNFQTVGQEVKNVELDFESGLGSREKMVIFTDVGNHGAQAGTGGQSGIPTPTLSGTYIIDNISIGATSPDTDASLSDLQVDAVTIPGFGSGITGYTYSVTDGMVPTITATANDAGASVVITPAAGIPGDTTVEVTAVDGITKQTYFISFTSPIELPFDFNGSIDGWTTGDGAAISNGAGNDVLQIVGAVHDWDNAAITFTTPIDLSDDANNTLRFSFQSTTALPGEVHQHGVSFQGGGGAIEVNFISTGQDVVDVELDFESGLGSREKMVIFTDVKNHGAQNATGGGLIDPGNTAAAESGTPTLSGTYIIDNISLGATVLSVDDFELSSFKAYPNPTQDSWVVKSKNQKISSIQVYDILGKQVLSLTPNTSEATIDGSSLKAGLYFAKIKSDNSLKSIKLVKK